MMSTIAIAAPGIERQAHAEKKINRIGSIDLLRGIVMIIMALDHTRDYFHRDAFLYNPEDLSHTSCILFFTRWITHFCAPVFVFLAGISAYLYGAPKSKKQLSFFLFTRGIWLIIAELFIVTLGWTFNPSYPFFNLQVIWATGVAMLFLSVIIYTNRWLIFLLAVLLIAGHNLLDNLHVPGNNLQSFAWSLLHQPGYFTFGNISFAVRYPVLPWIGIMLMGYLFGRIYVPFFDSKKRRKILLLAGIGATTLYIILRAGNLYGDASQWSLQKNSLFSVLSFLNVTKYPPSFLYVLMTLGPALIFLSFSEKPLRKWTSKIAMLGRVPMFYYLVHIFFIHLLAIFGAIICGYHWWNMILTTRVNKSIQLKGYGFSLVTVYIIWADIIIYLYPLCKWFYKYKEHNQHIKWWLRYL